MSLGRARCFITGGQSAQPQLSAWAAIAQLAARRSHNPKVVSSILTRRIFKNSTERLAGISRDSIVCAHTHTHTPQSPADIWPLCSYEARALECTRLQNELRVVAGDIFMPPKKKTVCPSGLRGWTQVPLAQAAWVQIPQLSFFFSRPCASD